MYIQLLELWEQPTFGTFIQPSNEYGFGDRAAHTPIDTVLFYTFKRYVCVYIEGYWIGSWSLGYSLLTQQTRVNQSQLSLGSIKANAIK